MRILFHVEPLVMHGRPFHYGAWLDRAAAMARTLAGRGHAFRFVLNEALAERACAPLEAARAGDPRRGQGLSRDWVVAVRQDEVRHHFNVPNMAILDGFHQGRLPAEKVAACGQALRARLAGFVPDVIVTYTPAAHLKAAFPGALLLHSENGMFSRAPFPSTQSFDPLGLYLRSLLGTHARELLARRAGDDERAWLDACRASFRAWLLASSPFHGLEQALRARYRRLALLPLQFGGEPGFDLNGPFRGQVELLLHVLERLPEGIGLIVTEHPTARRLGEGIDAETRAWVRARWPQVAWVEPDVMADGSQALMLHVDDVIGPSSSLAQQALFWRKPLVGLGWGLARAYASLDGVELLDPARPRDEEVDRDGAVAWMMKRYFVPDSLCLHDAPWIERFLERSRERHASGRLGLSFFDPVADDATLVTLHAAPAAPPARPAVTADLLRDGSFEDWHGARGAEQPRHWRFIAGRGANARVRPGSAADAPPGIGAGPARPARIERAAGGDEASLLLQRIADVERLSGAFVTVSFWARGSTGSELATYLHQQLDTPGVVGESTAARSFALEGEWRRFDYTTTVPVAPGSPRGPSPHTEMVFAVAPADGEQWVEVAGITLGPGRIDA